MSTKQKQQNLPEPLNTIWSGLKSLPVAVGVIIVLAILSALGTIIPQEHLAQPPMGLTLEQMYIERFGAQKYAIIKQLGLTHIYFTPYFFILLVWLSVSAVVCTASRIKNTIQAFQQPRIKHSPRFYANSKQAIVLDNAVADPAAKLEHDLRERHYRVMTAADGEATNIYADRGYLQRWAIAAIHVSAIILLAGAVYGKIYGTEGYIRMADNSEQTLRLDFMHGKHRLVEPLVSRLPVQEYQLDQDSFRIDYDKRIELPSMFAGIEPELQDYYLYFVKDYVSNLTVSRGDQSISGEVKVNHPVRLGKLNIYQSGYQQRGYMLIEQDGQETEYPLPSGLWFVIGPNGPMTPEQAMSSGVMVTEAFFAEPLKAGMLYVGGKPQGEIGPLTILRTARMEDGAASQGRMLTPEVTEQITVDGRPATLRLSSKLENYSDFSYKLDPGIPVLYFGWILMIISIALAMYVPFSRVHMRVEPQRTFVLQSGRGIESAKRDYAHWRDLLSH
ncbi:cytochrome c biogenesis protein ResB [bacterium]|nr:cytochrome c biogenesis protein ResB [bacterium]